MLTAVKQDYKVGDEVWTVCPVEYFIKQCEIVEIEEAGSTILTLETLCPYFEIRSFKREALLCVNYEFWILAEAFEVLPQHQFRYTGEYEEIKNLVTNKLEYPYNEDYSDWLVEYLKSIGWEHESVDDDWETYVKSPSSKVFALVIFEDKWCDYWKRFVGIFEEIAKELGEEPKELFKKINKHVNSNNRSNGVR